MDVVDGRTAGAQDAGGLAGDGKAPDALRTIGEVGSALGIRQHVLRYWEEQFPMLRPLKRSGGRRYYRPEDIELVRTIDRLVHHEGYTLRGARQVLDARPGKRARAAPPPAAAEGPVAQAEPTPLAEPAPQERALAEPVLAEPVPTIATALPADGPAEPRQVLNGLRVLRDRLAAALAAA